MRDGSQCISDSEFFSISSDFDRVAIYVCYDHLHSSYRIFNLEIVK